MRELRIQPKLRGMSMNRTLIAATISLSVLLTGCSSHSEEMSHSSSSSSVDYSVYDANAVMFAQMMIPHHDQAVTMAELALRKSSDRGLLALARQISSAQGAEIALMTKWLQVAGAPLEAAGDHSGHMSGMLTAVQLTALEEASGTDFDVLFLESMIEHHEGALLMTQDLVANSSNAEVAALAADIIENQTAEIAYMKELLSTY